MISGTDNYGWSQETPQSTGYILPVIQRVVKTMAPTAILDLGCGNGSILRGLLGLAAIRVGCDADAEGLELAHQADPSAQYVHRPIEAPGIPLHDAPFDVILSTEVVEHLYNPDDLFVTARRNAHGNTHFVVTTPYHGWLKNVAIAATGKWDQHHTPLWHGGHIKFWSRPTLTQLAARNGWTTTAFYGIGRCPFLWKSMLMVFRMRSP